MTKQPRPLTFGNALSIAILVVIASFCAIAADTGGAPVRLKESEEAHRHGGATMKCFICTKIDGVICRFCNVGDSTCDFVGGQGACGFNYNGTKVTGCTKDNQYKKCVKGVKTDKCDEFGSKKWCGTPEYPLCPAAKDGKCPPPVCGADNGAIPKKDKVTCDNCK